MYDVEVRVDLTEFLLTVSCCPSECQPDEMVHVVQVCVSLTECFLCCQVCVLQLDSYRYTEEWLR